MEWNDLSDPNGQVEFQVNWLPVSAQYTPEMVDELLQKHGVSGMVRIVNEHFDLVYGHKTLQLGHTPAGQKMLTNY